MGCASSVHNLPATDDALMTTREVNEENIVPTDGVVLKELPEVVEKVIDCMSTTDAKLGLDHTKEFSNYPEKPGVHAYNTDSNDDDTYSDGSMQGIIQGVIDDSLSIHSKQYFHESVDVLGENYSVFAPESDSLRTSSPESEIEQALANNTEENPPTPKPTFSELKDVELFSSSLIDNINEEKSDLRKPLDMPSNNNLMVLNHLTEWEKQADILASTQKYNPIEAMRKLRKENRSSSSLPHREAKVKTQRYVDEDLSEFFSTQGFNGRDLSSAKSERSVIATVAESEPNCRATKSPNNLNHRKAHEIQAKKLPVEKKKKENTLSVSQNRKGAPSPSLYKVRERCAVCCNKYKHL